MYRATFLSIIAALTVIPGMTIAGEPSAGPTSGLGPAGIVTSANSEVTRRAALTAEADANIIEARRLAADGKPMEALDILAAVRANLPESPMTLATRSAARDAFTSIGMQEAGRLATEARYAEAKAILQRILAPAMEPDCSKAKNFLAQLDDPVRYPPARSPEFSAKQAKVVAGLRDAVDLVQAARYDDAIKAYNEVLRVDPYNSAARQGMEAAERAIIDYLGAARNHTRAQMLRQVEAKWESANPEHHALQANQAQDAGDASQQEIADRNRQDLLGRKMKRLIIDQIKIDGEPLREAINIVMAKARMADREAKQDETRGVNIVLDVRSDAEAVAKDWLDREVRLELRNTPLYSVVDYLAKQAGLAIRIEPFAVVLVPTGTADDYMFSRTYMVPPDFIASVATDTSVAGSDPFAAQSRDNAGGLAIKRLSPKEFLEQSGITFTKNAFAAYNPRTSTLSMRNTATNHEILEDMVEKSRTSTTPQVAIESRMIEIQEDILKELGFDWLLGAFDVGNGVAIAGGVDPGFATAAGMPLTDAGTPAQAVGANPVTAGNRSGDTALTTNAMDKLILNGFQTAQDQAKRAPGVLSVAGILTEPRFQVVMRALSQSKGKDFLNAPSVVTRSGMPAHIEVVREFIYPTEYDPPEIPNNVSSQPGQQTPITPASPTSFETTNIGSILDVEPIVSADGRIVEVNIETVHREFIGFVNYGTPITSALGTTEEDNIVITPNRILQPVFETRRLKTSSSVYDGQTLVIGGLMTESGENIEDKVPLLGEVPILGRFFKSKVKENVRKVLLIFLKVDTLDPSGRPMLDTRQNTPTDF